MLPLKGMTGVILAEISSNFIHLFDEFPSAQDKFGTTANNKKAYLMPE